MDNQVRIRWLRLWAGKKDHAIAREYGDFYITVCGMWVRKSHAYTLNGFTALPCLRCQKPLTQP